VPTTIIATVDPASSRVDARTEQAQPIHMDTDSEGSDASAPGPKETLLAALAGCTAIDVASILRKKRQSAATYEVAVSAESAESHPKVFTAISVEHRVTGDVTDEALRRAVELSSTRYCPVSAMLSKSVTIEHGYRLLGGDGAERSALVAITGPAGARIL